MNYRVLFLAGLLVLAAVACACSGQSYGSEDPSKIRVGIVFDIGGRTIVLLMLRLGRIRCAAPAPALMEFLLQTRLNIVLPRH